VPGKKTNKGLSQTQTRYYHRGQEYKPSAVITKKVVGNGHKKIIGCQSVETGEILRNTHGRPAPWHSVHFSPNKEDTNGD